MNDFTTDRHDAKIIEMSYNDSNWQLAYMLHSEINNFNKLKSTLRNIIYVILTTT